jgi:tRNA(Ile)-lysidine synthase
MGLAVLCSHYQKLAGTTLPYVKFQAFVVDHGVRKGSDLEAKAVSETLKDWDIPTRLLKIDWAGHESPAELPSFESLARRYRFQALGKACRDLGINSLFLAHHEDDQAETVIMRLVTGHRMAGLSGIQTSSEIPECYGLHGVHESGGIDNATNKASKPSFSDSSTLTPHATEYGGVKVYRPLLRFSKERLIATCREEGMKWFEDHTNKDPTVTMRNAIRHIYRNHALPAALSKPGLLELSRKAQLMKDTSLEITNTWLRQSSVKLDTRTGTLKVHFANLNQYPRSHLAMDGKYVAALLLRRIAMLITPQEHIEISSLMGAVGRIFPECFETQESPPTTSAFTAAGLQFRVNGPAKPQRPSKRSEKCEWLISRQPYMSKAALPQIEIPANLESSADPAWSAWNLHDGRFWIRVLNLSNMMIVVRPFRDHDLAGFRNSLSENHSGKLPGMLSKLAPGKIRWTLPAITKQGLDGDEELLALPTLDVGVLGIEKLVKWEVRYKKIDTDILTMAGGN